ncbi:MAG TPA: hypothetical protein ENI22_01130 [Candidatus Pacearchaeota archaeon]|nr:hypothetical protein [Candidatus Pacearchaeota archaeon]
MAKKEFSLNEVKKNYEKFQIKYNLPSFEKLNEDFQIEKIAENETDYLLREVKKAMADKFYNYLRFTETLLNPVNAPLFVFSIIKSIDAEKKKKLNEIYKKLAKNEIRIIEVDLIYSEKKEAEFIKESYKLWQEIKEELMDIIKNVKGNWDNKLEGKRKGYFG